MRTGQDAESALYHAGRVFDRENRIRNIYSSSTLDPRLVLADVKTLLLEEAKVSRQQQPYLGGKGPHTL